MQSRTSSEIFQPGGRPERHYRQPSLRYVRRQNHLADKKPQHNIAVATAASSVTVVDSAPRIIKEETDNISQLLEEFQTILTHSVAPLSENIGLEPEVNGSVCSFDMLPKKPHRISRPAPVNTTKEPVSVNDTLEGDHEIATKQVHDHVPASYSIMMSRTPPPSAPVPLKHRLPRMRQSTLIYSMALLVFIAGISASIQGFFVNEATQAQVKSATIASSNDDQSSLPSEEEPVTDASTPYNVAPNYPRMITIPKLNVHARVTSVGVDRKNELQTPKNIYDTAWYSNSAKPGEQGAQLINGHSSGVTKPGVFKNLKNLSVGDALEVERGDGTKYSYTVRLVFQAPTEAVDMQRLLSSYESDRPGLNLITCAGKFNRDTNSFADRVLVFATQN